MSPINRIPELVQRLYEITRELSRLFPGRPFTLDGHLVGSIGEVIAAHRYGLALLSASSSCHDALAPDGRYVQVKATQGKSVALRAKPDYMIVLQIKLDGTIEEIYNGPGDLVWNASAAMQKNGQRPIRLTKLRILANTIPKSAKIPVKTSK